MIRVSEGLSHDRPSLIVVELLYVEKDSEQLDSSDSRMSVVELNLVKLGEVVPVSVIKFEALNDILNSCRAEEVLLLES